MNMKTSEIFFWGMVGGLVMILIDYYLIPGFVYSP